MKLKGKVAVVTGGNSGIGLAAGRAFVAEGAKVVLAARDRVRLKAAAKQLPDALIVPTDISSSPALEELARAVKEAFGGVDVLFANAGVLESTPIDKADESQVDRIMGVNFKGSFLSVQKLLPLMRDGASIIINTSVVNTMGLAGMSVYSASKAALSSLARTLAAELAPRGIRVNALSPGPIETPMYEAVVSRSEESRKWMQSKILLGRAGRPEEVARAAVYLASEDSSFVTGTELVVDGGMSLAR